jgi:hypothetical protein
MAVRRFFVGKALNSFKGLTQTIGELTEEEVLYCLKLEAGTLRRQSVIDRLISRASRLHELRYIATLKEKIQWHVNRRSSSLPPN